MKFLVDMPLSPDLAQWLRAEGHDAVHAAELSMYKSPDSELLQLAAGTGRVIITRTWTSRDFWPRWVRPD